MKAERCPTDPFTTMSMPFIEMPHRAEALPSTTSRPPQPVAPAACEASPFTWTRPDIMFSATPCPAEPLTTTVASLVHSRAVVADMPLDLDCDRRVDAGGDRVLPARIEHPPMRLVGERAETVQRRVELAQRGPREVDGAHISAAPTDTLWPASAPRPGRCRCRADRPARDTRCRTRPNGPFPP